MVDSLESKRKQNRFYRLFVNEMKKKRISKECNYADIEVKTDISCRTLYRWEWGHIPKLYHAMLVAKEMKIDLNSILERAISEGDVL